MHELVHVQFRVRSEDPEPVVLAAERLHAYVNAPIISAPVDWRASYISARIITRALGHVPDADRLDYNALNNNTW